LFRFHARVLRHGLPHRLKLRSRLTLSVGVLAAAVQPVARAQDAETPSSAVVSSHQPCSSSNSPPTPRAPRRPRRAATVAVNVQIDTAGNVTGVALARGVAPALDRAALQAASRWRFRPAVRGGVAVPSRVQLLFHFEPPPVSSPPPAGLTPVPQPAAATPAPGVQTATPETPPSAPAVRAPSALDVTVLGRRPATSRGVSDFQLRVDQLADVPRANASELLKLAPGSC